VLSQTYTDFEIIVVDDGSTDRTAEKVAEVGSGVRLIRQANRGLPLARNAGILAAHGKLVAFLDADDVWLPDFLKKQLQLLDANGGHCLVFCDSLLWDGTNPPTTIWGAGGPAFDERDPLLSIVRSCCIPANTVILPRDVLTDVGLFHEVSGEDMNLWKRIALRGIPFRKNPTPLVWYRQRSGSISHSQGSGRSASENLVAALTRIDRDPTMPAHVRTDAAERVAAMPRRFTWLAFQALLSGDFREARACWLDALKAQLWNPLYIAGFVSSVVIPKPTRWLLSRLGQIRRALGRAITVGLL